MVEQKIIDEFLANFDSPLEAVQSIRDHVQKSKTNNQVKTPYKIPDTPVVVSVKDLTRTYKVGRTKVEALRGVSLNIHEGEFIALTGPSGSGKSTLLQLIGGLDKPTGGDVLINNTNIAKLSDAKLSEFRNQVIGFVFQFFYLQPFLNVRRNIEVPGMFAKIKPASRRETSDLISKSVDIYDRLNHKPSELSGGQMQRAAIARALLNRPKLLIADEPTGNLDSKTSAQIIDLFEQIRQEFGTTIVVVTHDPKVAEQADREIKMLDGAII